MSNEDDNGITVTEPVHDLYLRLLIKVLEQDASGSSSMAITLSTNSGVVTGDLITREGWKSRWADQLKGATGNGVELMKTFFDDIDAVLDQQEEEDGAARNPLPRFIHLKDATLFVPGANRVGFPLWRGRLDSIVGWSIGAVH